MTAARLLKGLFAASAFFTAASASAQSVSPSCDNDGFRAAQQTFESNYGKQKDVPVHVCGKVVAVSYKARRTRSGWHGYFYVSVGAGDSIRIVSDLDEMSAPQWPWVARGDNAEIVGRYYYDSPRRQGIDWTHHGTGRSWSTPGYVVINGTKYE